MVSWLSRGTTAVLIVMLISGSAQADSLETLLMPGPLIQGHAKFEKECYKCHDLFKKTGQNQKCLDCHKFVAKDISKKRGFHGKSKDVKVRQCKFCHTDHEGREMDIVKLDRESFNHNLADFLLKGKHRKVNCVLCHVSGKKFREAPKKCYDCHRKDDPHFKRMGTRCDKCHNQNSWEKGKFDHNKTRFSLTGKHIKVSCDSCHPNQRFKKTPMQCFSCHRSNDIHGGRFGKKCDSCHRTIGWKTFHFDHNRDTKFPLKESHAKLRCEACHKTPAKGKTLKRVFKGKMEKECWACHKGDDPHKDRFGRECDKCHNSSIWEKSFFSHSKDTKFELIGAHSKLECRQCHKTNAYKEKLKTTCYACHKSDDVHKGQQGEKCDKCHNSESWTGNVKFDHNSTRFPLVGLHILTSCENCHLTPVYKDVKNQCVDCHANDDVHKQRLGPECKTCHTPDGWNLWRFDHDKQTKFPLNGAHGDLNCYSCHIQPVKEKIKMKKSCYSCHKSDDVHKGQQGKQCDQCHREDTWGDQVRFEHDLTQFPLIGMHAVTSCENCHLTPEYKQVKKTCAGCHQKDDVHKNQLSPECELCHNPNGWKLWIFDHNTQTKFKLEGAHEGLDCLGCHKDPVKKKITLSKECGHCHRADDVHRGRFGRNCGRCHTSKSFKEIEFTR